MATLERVASDAAGAGRPRRPKGLELIGRYEGSGFREPTYLVRRADGQVVRLSRLLYLVAAGADGRTDLAALSHMVSGAFGRPLSPDDLRFLIDHKLRPAGVLAAPNGSSPRLERARPLLALRARVGVVPQPVVQAIAGLLRPLFLPPVVLAVLGLLLALDAWLFLDHGVLRSFVYVARDPGALLFLVALTLLGTVFHEWGHASACRYGGARAGRMGVGLYLIWPAFYTDLTDVYRLGRAGRLRADLGGVYFNGVFVLLAAGAYFATGFEPLIAAILVQHYQVLFQLLPVVRLDGHYVLSDLTGVPDILSRTGPTIRSLIPGRKPDRRIEELRPRVRRALWAYAVTTTVALAGALGFFILQLPRLVSTAVDRSQLEVARAVDGFAGSDPTVALAGVLGLVVLSLPLLGAAVTAALIGKHVRRAAGQRGLAIRTLLWPEPGHTASALMWNSLFATAVLLGLASLALMAQGLVGGEI
jgi:putative peptide zinc metalloprotease protein